MNIKNFRVKKYIQCKFLLLLIESILSILYAQMNMLIQLELFIKNGIMLPSKPFLYQNLSQNSSWVSSQRCRIFSKMGM